MNTFVITGRVSSSIRIKSGLLDNKYQKTGTFTVYTAPPKKSRHMRTGNYIPITVTYNYAITLSQILTVDDPVSITGHLQSNGRDNLQVVALRVEKLDALPCSP